MSIRIRTVNGARVALCAALSIEKPGDVYLNDEDHHALASKFTEDFHAEGGLIAVNLTEAAVRHGEENHNQEALNRQETSRPVRLRAWATWLEQEYALNTLPDLLRELAAESECRQVTSR